MFAHERLHVYAKALGFVAEASNFSAVWNKKHAVVDQLNRASESLILNLAVRYGAALPNPVSKPLFHHETLDVYGAALELMTWFVSLPGGKVLSNRLYRQLDEGVTSTILNIAEGNGRYSELDHRRFLDVAEGSAVKVAAYLDLAVQKLTLVPKESGPGKALLERVVAMLSRM